VSEIWGAESPPLSPHCPRDRYKTAKQLVSQDFKSNVARFKYTFSTEIAPICKHDIVVLPKSLAAVLGCIEPVVLVYQVTNFMRLVSPVTVQTAELTATRYVVLLLTPFFGCCTAGIVPYHSAWRMAGAGSGPTVASAPSCPLPK